MDDHKRNVPIIEKLYEAFRHGDLSSIQSLLDENVDWLFVGPSEELPWAGPRHGRAATMESFFRIAAEKLEVLEFESRELMEFDDKVLSLGHERMRVKATENRVKSCNQALGGDRVLRVIPLTLRASVLPPAGNSNQRRSLGLGGSRGAGR